MKRQTWGQLKIKRKLAMSALCLGWTIKKVYSVVSIFPTSNTRFWWLLHICRWSIVTHFFLLLKQTNGRTLPQDLLPPRLASSSSPRARRIRRCFVCVSTIACFDNIHFHEFWGNILNSTSDCVCLENFYSLPWMDFRCDVIYVYHFPLWLSARYCRWALLIVWNSFASLRNVLEPMAMAREERLLAHKKRKKSSFPRPWW